MDDRQYAASCEYPMTPWSIIEHRHHLVVACSHCFAGWSVGLYESLPEDAKAALGTTCHICGNGVYQEDVGIEYRTIPVCRTPGCFSTDVEERHSMGISAGFYCDAHYETDFPYRKDAVYDYLDAGEHYDDDY